MGHFLMLASLPYFQEPFLASNLGRIDMGAYEYIKKISFMGKMEAWPVGMLASVLQ